MDSLLLCSDPINYFNKFEPGVNDVFSDSTSYSSKSSNTESETTPSKKSLTGKKMTGRRIKQPYEPRKRFSKELNDKLGFISDQEMASLTKNQLKERKNMARLARNREVWNMELKLDNYQFVCIIIYLYKYM